MEFGTIELIVLLVVFLISLYFLRLCRKATNENRRKPPSFPSLPFVGSLPFLGNGDRLYHFFMKKSEELGSVYTFYGGRRLALVLNGREAIDDALLTHAVDFADRCPLWTEANCLNTQLKGITFKHYDESFKQNHAIISAILGQISSGDNSITATRIRQGVEVAIEEIRKINGDPFDPKCLFAEISGRIILGILFGERFLLSYSCRAREIVESSRKYLANIDPMIDMMPILRFLPSFRNKIKVMADSKNVLLRCYAEELETSTAEDADNSFVKSLAESESNLDSQELIHILRDLVFGGTEPISGTLLWMVVLLANNPDIQHQLRKEIESVVPSERLPVMRDKDRLPYAEAVMLEILRRNGVTPFSSTRATLNDTKVGGYFVPAGSMVLINLYSVHMNAKYWKDPEAFRPERFLNEEKKVIRKDEVIPFCLGMRSCIGESIARQEIFLLLCSLVQQFDILPPIGLDSISEKEIYKLVLIPPPFKVRLIPRQPHH